MFPTRILSFASQLPICPFNQFNVRFAYSTNTSLSHGSATTVELAALLSLGFFAHGNGLIASKTLPHVDHSAFAFSVTLFQLLAARREFVDQRRSQALGGSVTRDEDAVGILEAGGQSSAC